jgi:hypothetical protein
MRLFGCGTRARKWDKISAERLKLRLSLPINRGRKRDAKIKMEIAPIPGIRALPAVKAPQADLRPPSVFDIDPSAKPGDGQEQKNGRKAAGAEENDQDDVTLESEAEAGAEEREEVPARQVDYFA